MCIKSKFYYLLDLKAGKVFSTTSANRKAHDIAGGTIFRFVPDVQSEMQL